VHESIILSFPPPICIARPGAILLHNYWAVYDSPILILFARRELVTIQRMLNRAAGVPVAGSAVLTRHEASPMDVATAGELVFRVMRLRAAGARWLRGWLRADVMQVIYIHTYI